MSHPDPQVLILDDGELADVRAIFEELRVPFMEDPSEAHSAGDESIPLLVTSAQRAHALLTGDAALPPHHLFVVVADEGAPLGTLRCDFVLRRPIEPAVLRLLSQRASYEGPERRGATRVAIGEPCTLIVDGHRRKAVLAQLSIRGCGLVVQHPLRKKHPVRIELPDTLTASRPLELTGSVINTRPARTTEEEKYDVSVVFDDLDIRARVTLRAVMAGRLIDFRPKPSLGRVGGQIAPGGTARAIHRVPEAGERRGEARRRYHRQILAGIDGGCRALLGRDISTGGMRIEREADVSIGDELKLAIYGGGHTRAVVLRAVVERDDGAEGWFLRFREAPPPVAEDLARLLASLAPVDLLAPRAREVVAEVIDDDESHRT
jgi:hypothetical protein